MLKECLEKDNDRNFSKNFKQIEMVWVGKIETPVNLVAEKEMEKIPKFKSLKMATSSAGKSGVFMRDKSCICKECQPGNVLCCTDERNGSYIRFDLRKGDKNRSTGKNRRMKSLQVHFFIPYNE